MNIDTDPDFLDDEDEQPIPFTSRRGPTPAELRPIAERVAQGIATGSNADGGIVPFPARLTTSTILAGLTGEEHKKVQGLRAHGYTPTVFGYTDADGHHIRFLVRFDHPTEPKIPLPLIYCGKGKHEQDVFWFSDIKGSKPLYGLHLLVPSPDADVLIVEGEKAADAARIMLPHMVVMTWPNGAGAVRRVDMTMLTGRRVIVWPDNDPAGREAARLFAARALEAGAARASVVEVPREFSAGWDLADPLPSDLPPEHSPERLLATARPMSPAEAEAVLRNPQRQAAARRLLGHPPGYSRVVPEAAEAALAMLDPDMDGAGWRRVARCWYHARGGPGLAAFDAWSARGSKYKAGEPAELWRLYAEEPAFRATPLIWLLRQAARAAEEKQLNEGVDAEAIVTAEIEALNENHAVVLRGSKTVVMRETFDPRFGRYQIEYLKKGDFVDKHVRSIQLPGDDGKPGKTVPQGSLWFKTAWRREYDGVVFLPGGDAGRGMLNLWRGFAVEPADSPEGWALLKEHLLRHVAQGDVGAYAYILNWLAHGVQRLDRRNGTALVLTGPKGAGKSILIELYGYLFGAHKFVTSISEDIVGKFNAHLEHTLVLGVEEAFAPQNRAADGTLKDLITRETLRVEDKFFSTWTARNHLRIIMTSNNDHVVRADGSDRRYAVFEVANPHQADPDARRAYFGAMVQQMETGGYEAMLGELLARDISGWNPEAIPETAALRKQKLLNLANNPVESWLHERLADGVFIVPGDGPLDIPYRWGEDTPTVVPAAAAASDFVGYCRRNGYRSTERAMAMKLKTYMPAGFESRVERATEVDGRGTRRVYDFPPLEIARDAFARATGISSWREAGGG